MAAASSSRRRRRLASFLPPPLTHPGQASAAGLVPGVQSGLATPGRGGGEGVAKGGGGEGSAAGRLRQGHPTCLAFLPPRERQPSRGKGGKFNVQRNGAKTEATWRRGRHRLALARPTDRPNSRAEGWEPQAAAAACSLSKSPHLPSAAATASLRRADTRRKATRARPRRSGLAAPASLRRHQRDQSPLAPHRRRLPQLAPDAAVPSLLPPPPSPASKWRQLVSACSSDRPRRRAVRTSRRQSGAAATPAGAEENLANEINMGWGEPTRHGCRNPAGHPAISDGDAAVTAGDFSFLFFARWRHRSGCWMLGFQGGDSSSERGLIYETIVVKKDVVFVEPSATCYSNPNSETRAVTFIS